jgi:hypothetical protein
MALSAVRKIVFLVVLNSIYSGNIILQCIENSKQICIGMALADIFSLLSFTLQ